MTDINDNYKANAIVMGEQREKYDDWFRGASNALKQVFAEHGYYPDELIHDDDIYVGLAVVEYSLQYCAKYARYLLKRQLKQEDFNWVLSLCSNARLIDKETLTLILDSRYGLGSIDLRAIHLKLQGFDHNPSIIQQTMDRYQLYRINNPQWTKDISINAIKNVQYIEDKYIDMRKPQHVPEELFHAVIGQRLRGIAFSQCQILCDDYMRNGHL